MKKILILSGVLLLSSYEANAQVSVEATFGEPIYYVEPYRGYVLAPDWPSQHYDHHRHFHNDYWARRDWERRERWEHDHHGHR